MKRPWLAQLAIVAVMAIGLVASVASAGATPKIDRSASVSSPRLTLHPRRAAPGATVTAEVNGYRAAQYVPIVWASKTGAVLIVTMTDSAGHVVVVFKVPATAPGTYTVYAFGRGGPDTTAKLVVT